ncbi:FKBP-type peptidyl-prolyl cis-trans isomerase N-terminal domain-containing protein [Erwinia sp. SLM-02]|uniref:FKBP-type peptidyl-prolyl cis-trans isomerase N-terminal domain-containing protein n=1 Tax=Erwinia sp. SLM-02 TaxID=3020057 RepID=UPI00308104C6
MSIMVQILISRYRAITVCALTIAAAGYPATEGRASDTGVPAILQFAEQYRVTTKETENRDPAAGAATPRPQSRPTSATKVEKPPTSAWRLNNDKQLLALNQALKASLQRQEALEQENQRLKRPPVKIDVAGALGRGWGALQQQLTVPRLPAEPIRALTRDELNQTDIRQDYAAGISLGSEILRMQSEHQQWGVPADKRTILAGIRDLFDGHARLTPGEVNDALAAVDRKVAASREKTLAQQTRAGKAYQATFMQQKGALTAEMGYGYRIDYRGKGQIASDAVVEVAVKEMRVDGKVIQDMDAGGALLSQRVDEFPPVFRDALSRLENHGSITLLVPPDLAYGEAGYPPDIPPGAYMIYQIRISDVYDAGATTVRGKAG